MTLQHPHQHTKTDPRVHLALITANSLFGFGSVIGALGLPATNPLVFTFVREVLAGMILLGLAALANHFRHQKKEKNLSGVGRDPHGPSVLLRKSRVPRKRTLSTFCHSESDISDHSGSDHESNNDDPNNSNIPSSPKFAKHNLIPTTRSHRYQFGLLGFFMFANQACYIMGIKLAGPIAASIWQPAIFTACLSMLVWKMEPLCWKRMGGVLMGLAGCAGMVLLESSAHKSSNETTTTASDNSAIILFVMGNLLFATNCLNSSLFVLQSKTMLQRYPPLVVVGWSYLVASVFMFGAAFVSSFFPHFFCCRCAFGEENGFWSYLHIPAEAWPALLFFILGMSVTAWSLILWANQTATGTLVVAYDVVQPLASLVATFGLLVGHIVPSCDTSQEGTTTTTCLHPPVASATMVGLVAVFTGLAVIIATEPSTASTIILPLDEGLKEGNNDDDALAQQPSPLVIYGSCQNEITSELVYLRYET